MIPCPPRELMFDGPQDEVIFRANGQEFLTYYRELAGLLPTDVMLDVGSGIGRKTIPLTEYLNSQAIYQGIDCSEVGVRWCHENISSAFPNFHFQHVDVYSPAYNSGGRIQPSEFEFPFQSAGFDFVVLGSVFTHMRFADMRHYLMEVSRVLKPAGRCLITYFLWSGAEPHPQFPHPCEHGWAANPAIPEQAIAFDEEVIKIGFDDAGFSIQRIEHGSWSGRNGLSYQDIIVAVKD